MNEETFTEKMSCALALGLFIAGVYAVCTSPDISTDMFWTFAEMLRKVLASMTIACVGLFLASLCDVWRKNRVQMNFD